MKVLITGSHGTLGRAFTLYLKERGIPFCRYDRHHPLHTERDFDSVVNFAGLTAHSPEMADKGAANLLHEVNVEGTKRVLAFIARNKKLKRFVHIGTSAEYGSSKTTLTERSPSRPQNEYGRTKLEQTKLVEEFSRTYAVKTFNLRIFNLLGVPRHPAQKKQFIDEYVLSQLLGNAPTTAVSNTKDMRDYIDMQDAFDAILAALISKKGSRYELINICSGEGTSLSKLVRIFEHETNRRTSLVSTNRSATRYVGSRLKAMRLLGWKPTQSLGDIVCAATARKKRVLIVGAGVACELILKEFEKDSNADVIVAGIVDDDPKKQGGIVRGGKVIGTIGDIPHLASTHHFDQILVSVPSAGSRVAARVASLAPQGIPIKVLPSIASVILGKVSLAYIRDIDPSDIIGRPLVKTDQQRIAKNTTGKTFLVTGGAGSIGSEIIRQLFNSNAKKIIVLDSSEVDIFHLSQELSRERGHERPELVFRLGNIRDRERLEEIAQEHRIDCVVHAAAYKHVPLLEMNPGEAHKTNELGTRNILDMAITHHIPDFVLISTDKAVNPLSVLGRTKRAAELLVQQYAQEHGDMRFMAVRFGNVLNSSGSMLPTFLRQIRERTPLTITHKEVTRYFMSIPEAASLVLMCWVIGENGQLLLLDMGEPVKILDFAEKLVRMHGLVPYEDVPIVEIGLRPGEKLHEELAYDAGKLRQSSVPRIFIAEEIDRRYRRPIKS